MTFKVYKWNEASEVQHFLNGGIMGTNISKGVVDLVGKTITFSNPAFSHTFVEGTTGPDLRFLEIKSQLELANPDILVTQLGGRIGFIERVPSTGVILAADSTGGHAVLVGTVDLSTLSYGGSGDLDGDDFVLAVNGGGSQTVTFVAPANQHDVVDQINAVVSPDLVASLNSSGYLRL
jgi:hypothetical protein